MNHSQVLLMLSPVSVCGESSNVVAKKFMQLFALGQETEGRRKSFFLKDEI